MGGTAAERRLCLAVMMVTVVLAACSGAPRVTVDRNSHADFANFRTFAWLEKKSADSGASKVGGDALATERARESVTAALQAKGYTYDEAHPDVRVSYVLDVYERPKQSGLRIGLGAGGGSGNVSGGVGVSLPVGKRNETVAAMAVDVFEASRNAPVWHGASEVILPGEVATDADVQKLTDAILARYPASAK